MTTSNPNVRPPKADIGRTGYQVRFVPIGDIAPLFRRTELGPASRNHKAASRLPPLSSFLKIVKASDGGLRNENSRGRQNGNHSGIRYIGTRVFGARV